MTFYSDFFSVPEENSLKTKSVTFFQWIFLWLIDWFLFTWKTVSSALIIESKFEVGVPSGKLSWPPKNCIPSSAKIKIKRKRRRRRDMIEERAFIRAITRLRRGDQYLYIYKVVIFVYFFICLIIIKEAFKRFVWNLIWELGRTTGMFLVWFKI